MITTIFPPSAAVRAFARRKGHRLIVVGDRKTPTGWSCSGAEFLSLARQMDEGGRTARALPVDHYCRKMIGYLHAMSHGARTIVDTDDDNIPKPGWGFPPFGGRFPSADPADGWVNIYTAFTRAPVWPRGFPLELIRDPRTRLRPSSFSPRFARVGVWQGLADGNPDVDAVYRLSSDRPTVFGRRRPFVLPAGAFTPFNSQNTAFAEEAFPLLYLPACVSFRFTDILRSYVAQPVLWAHGLCVGIAGATVVQRRNEHDYLKDFESELPFYLGADRIRRICLEAAAAGRSVAERMRSVYRALAAQGVVPARELRILDAWLKDVARCMEPGRRA